MKKIEGNELEQISGGAIGWGVVAGIVAGITFIIGLVEGYTNPSACNG